MKEISIIIATYNAEKYIRRCLDSIIPQKNDTVELIIIDGKSTDNTTSIIKEYIDSIDFFVSEKDAGVYDAWNKGIKNAQGNWIQFIGADDRLLPHSIDSYLHFLNTHDLDGIDFISARSEYVNVHGKLLQYRGSQYIWSKFRKFMCISHGSTLHSKLLFNEVGGYDLKYKLCADYELLLRKKEKTKALFFDQPVIKMQAGGISFSLAGQVESFLIKKQHKTISLAFNLYHLVRGMVGFVAKKIIWDIEG